MANTKISALPASTTPLAGTEVLPIVQSSTTRQVSVANLTAGRAVATGALTVTGAATVSTTLGVTGATTLSAALTYGGITLSNAVTGTGKMVLDTSPTLVTPTLGVATATSLQGIIGNVTPAAGAFTSITASTTLGVTGDASISNATGVGGRLNLISTDTGGAAYALVSGGSTNTAFPTGALTIRDTTAGVNRVVINSTGVGIGTESINAKLNVKAVGNTYISGCIALESASSVKNYITAIADVILFGSSTSADMLAVNVYGVGLGGTTPSSGTGITFPATQSASSNANTLDDYEEGTWTPSFTLNSGSATATAAAGTYIKIGRQVSITISITFSVPVAALIDNITGLPFTTQNTTQTSVGAIRENANTGYMWHLRPNTNLTTALLRRYDNNQTLTDAMQFVGTAVYFTA